jgi:hypothetical protein
MNCSHISEKLVDYLYGELAADARAAFETHVQGCENCRREVTALDRARTTARTALRGALDQPAPAQVRSRVLEAAAAAAARGHGHRAAVPAQTVEPKAAAETRSTAPGPKSVGGFWQWLPPRPWVIPAFAAASAMTVFVIARQVVLQPEKVIEIEAAQLPPPSPAQSPHPFPEETDQPPKGKADLSLEGRERSDQPALGGGILRDSIAKKGTVPQRRAPSSPPRAQATAPAVSSRWATPPPPASKEPAARAFEMAPPPSPRMQRKAAPPVEAAADHARAEAAFETVLEPAPSAASTSGAEEASLAKSRPAGATAGAAERPRAPAPAVRKKAEASSADEAAGAPWDELVRRADRLFREGSRVEAAATYRELLRRFPEHPDVPLWKRRLVELTATAP